jgi:LysM repeat protein
LKAWAALTGAVYLRPIQGCYSPGLDASKGTHDLGGVYDIEADGLSLADFHMLVNTGRSVLLLTFGRWWDGNHHVHLIDPDCPDLAPLAVAQVEQFRDGETGLAGHADRDTWNRSTAAAILRAFDNRLDVKAPAPAKHRTFTIPKGGTLGKAAVALGVSVAALASWNRIPDANVVQPGTVVTAPPSGYSAPAPKPSPKPTVAKPKPAPKPKPKPRPVVKPKPKPNSSPGVYTPSLRVGRSGASVLTYERALRAYLGAKTANRYGLTAARASDRYFGTATAAATRAAYKRLGVTPWATSPGPFLLRTLHLKATR